MLTVPTKQTVFRAGKGSSQTGWTKSGVRENLGEGEGGVWERAVPHSHPLEPTGS